MRVVVDASAVLALLLRTPILADKVLEHLEKAQGDVHMPHLLDVEVAQILRRHAVANPSQAERCRQALRDLRDMPAFRYEHFMFLDRFWDLCGQMSASNATYLGLAEFLDASVLTCDTHLHSLNHRARIELVQINLE